jgi:alkylated DNA nucleotide flippase Atl1
MRAHEVSFLDLVQGEKQFQVPLYQRTFSWGEKQLAQLWRDLLAQSDAMSTGATDATHFIGSVVIAPSPTLQAAGVSRWLLVDGQQRLTALMLALTAIRDHLGDGAGGDADRIHRQYLVNEFRAGDDHLRLLPTQADRDTYRALVLRTAGSTTTGAIGDAYSFFRTVLIGIEDPGDDHDVAGIEQTIRAGLSIVEITAERGDNVYRIFESLNNTGLQLSQADLLRNYLFMRLPSRGEDVYRDVWLPMQNRLPGRELELLVWLDLVIRGDDRVKQTDIYRAQQVRLERLPKTEKAIEVEIAELARRSRHLERILNPEVEPDVRLRSALLRLKAWGAATAYPLVMHLFDLLEGGVATADEVTEALVYVESFLVRRMLCQVPTSNLNRVFNSAPEAIADQAPVAAAVRMYLSGRRRYWPSDAEVRRSARTRPFYWIGRAPQRTFALRRIEESYQAPEPVDFNTAKLTIEHVLPQTPTQEWLDVLADEVTDEAGPRELHELLVHTLGNLTLTAENAKLSNNPFQRKQDIFHSSALRMNREIADTHTWGKTQILQRADRMADRIIKIWPGPADGGSDDSEGRDWSLLKRACSALPPATWTSYGDLAELIGSHPVPVGVHLATHPVHNAWRVLMADGTISPSFRWEASERADDPEELLASEGITFVNGHADPGQRVTAIELAGILGMDAGDLPGGEDTEASIESSSGTLFLQQLTEAHPSCVDAVTDLLQHWQSLGGVPSFGQASEISCFMLLYADRTSSERIWPFTIYPKSGSIEVVFQHMRRRPVFSDPALRDEFRQRLQTAGIAIPESKLNLRPSFRIDALRSPATLTAVKSALEWFAVIYRTRLSQEQPEEQPDLGEVLGFV